MSEAIELCLMLEDEELLFTTDSIDLVTDDTDDRTWWGVKELDSKAWAALCLAVKREANRRERECGFRLPLEEE